MPQGSPEPEISDSEPDDILESELISAKDVDSTRLVSSIYNMMVEKRDFVLDLGADMSLGAEVRNSETNSPQNALRGVLRDAYYEARRRYLDRSKDEERDVVGRSLSPPPLSDDVVTSTGDVGAFIGDGTSIGAADVACASNATPTHTIPPDLDEEDLQRFLDIHKPRSSGSYNLRRRTFRNMYPYIADQCDHLDLIPVKELEIAFNSEPIEKIIRGLDNIYKRRKRQNSRSSLYTKRSFYQVLGDHTKRSTVTISPTEPLRDPQSVSVPNKETPKLPIAPHLRNEVQPVPDSDTSVASDQESGSDSSGSENDTDSDISEELISIGRQTKKKKSHFKGVLPLSAMRLPEFQNMMSKTKQYQNRSTPPDSIIPKKGHAKSVIPSKKRATDDLTRFLNDSDSFDEEEDIYLTTPHSNNTNSLDDEQLSTSMDLNGSREASMSSISRDSFQEQDVVYVSDDSDDLQGHYTDDSDTDVVVLDSERISEMFPRWGFAEEDWSVDRMLAPAPRNTNNQKPNKRRKVTSTASKRPRYEKRSYSAYPRAASTSSRPRSSVPSSRNGIISSNSRRLIGSSEGKTVKRTKQSVFAALQPYRTNTSHKTRAPHHYSESLRSSAIELPAYNVNASISHEIPSNSTRDKPETSRDKQKKQKQANLSISEIINADFAKYSATRSPRFLTTQVEGLSGKFKVVKKSTPYPSNPRPHQDPKADLNKYSSASPRSSNILDLNRLMMRDDLIPHANGIEVTTVKLGSSNSYKLSIFDIESSNYQIEQMLVAVHRSFLNRMSEESIRDTFESLKVLLRWYSDDPTRMPIQSIKTRLEACVIRCPYHQIAPFLLLLGYLFRFDVSKPKMYHMTFRKWFVHVFQSGDINSDGKSSEQMSIMIKLLFQTQKEKNDLGYWSLVNEAADVAEIKQSPVTFIIGFDTLMTAISSETFPTAPNWRIIDILLNKVKDKQDRFQFNVLVGYYKQLVEYCRVLQYEYGWPIQESALSALFDVFVSRRFSNFIPLEAPSRNLLSNVQRLPTESYGDTVLKMVVSYVQKADKVSRRIVERLCPPKLSATELREWKSPDAIIDVFVNKINVFLILCHLFPQDFAHPFGNLLRSYITAESREEKTFVMGRQLISQIVQLCLKAVITFETLRISTAYPFALYKEVLSSAVVYYRKEGQQSSTEGLVVVLLKGFISLVLRAIDRIPNASITEILRLFGIVSGSGIFNIDLNRGGIRNEILEECVSSADMIVARITPDSFLLEDNLMTSFRDDFYNPIEKLLGRVLTSTIPFTSSTSDTSETPRPSESKIIFPLIRIFSMASSVMVSQSQFSWNRLFYGTLPYLGDQDSRELYGLVFYRYILRYSDRSFVLENKDVFTKTLLRSVIMNDNRFVFPYILELQNKEFPYLEGTSSLLINLTESRFWTIRSQFVVAILTNILRTPRDSVDTKKTYLKLVVDNLYTNINVSDHEFASVVLKFLNFSEFYSSFLRETSEFMELTARFGVVRELDSKIFRISAKPADMEKNLVFIEEELLNAMISKNVLKFIEGFCQEIAGNKCEGDCIGGCTGVCNGSRGSPLSIVMNLLSINISLVPTNHVAWPLIHHLLAVVYEFMRKRKGFFSESEMKLLLGLVVRFAEMRRVYLVCMNVSMGSKWVCYCFVSLQKAYLVLMEMLTVFGGMDDEPKFVQLVKGSFEDMNGDIEDDNMESIAHLIQPIGKCLQKYDLNRILDGFSRGDLLSAKRNVEKLQKRLFRAVGIDGRNNDIYNLASIPQSSKLLVPDYI